MGIRPIPMGIGGSLFRSPGVCILPGNIRSPPRAVLGNSRKIARGGRRSRSSNGTDASLSPCTGRRRQPRWHPRWFRAKRSSPRLFERETGRGRGFGRPRQHPLVCPWSPNLLVGDGRGAKVALFASRHLVHEPRLMQKLIFRSTRFSCSLDKEREPCFARHRQPLQLIVQYTLPRLGLRGQLFVSSRVPSRLVSGSRRCMQRNKATLADQPIQELPEAVSLTEPFGGGVDACGS
jgi:hypothetical protein